MSFAHHSPPQIEGLCNRARFSLTEDRRRKESLLQQIQRGRPRHHRIDGEDEGREEVKKNRPRDRDRSEKERNERERDRERESEGQQRDGGGRVDREREREFVYVCENAECAKCGRERASSTEKRLCMACGKPLFVAREGNKRDRKPLRNLRDRYSTSWATLPIPQQSGDKDRHDRSCKPSKDAAIRDRYASHHSTLLLFVDHHTDHPSMASSSSSSSSSWHMMSLSLGVPTYAGRAGEGSRKRGKEVSRVEDTEKGSAVRPITRGVPSTPRRKTQPTWG